MNAPMFPIEMRTDSAGADALETLLRACDTAFVPPLSSRVDVQAYARKIAAHARRFEAWDGAQLAGLLAMYCNDTATRTAFVTSVSVAPGYARRGIGGALLRQAIDAARTAGMQLLSLETGAANAAALALYRKYGFAPIEQAGDTLRLALKLS